MVAGIPVEETRVPPELTEVSDGVLCFQVGPVDKDMGFALLEQRRVGALGNKDASLAELVVEATVVRTASFYATAVRAYRTRYIEMVPEWRRSLIEMMRRFKNLLLVPDDALIWWPSVPSLWCKPYARPARIHLLS